MKTNHSRSLRCYLLKEDNHWVAVCIDLSLAAQADLSDKAIEKLESMIKTYIEEARTIHKAYANQLLSRKAPLSQVLTFYQIALRSFFRKLRHDSLNQQRNHTFFETFPNQIA